MLGYLIDIMNAPSGKKIAKMKNNIGFMNWFQLFERYGRSRYDLLGLPDTIKPQLVKQGLLWYCSCTFFDKDNNLFCLPSMATQDYNVNGDPLFSWVYGRNGFNQNIPLYIKGRDKTKFIIKGVNGQIHTKYKGVFVRENDNLYPFINYVYDYAYKMNDTSRTIDTTRFHYKNPDIITCKEEVKPTIDRMMSKRAENEEYETVSTGIFEANSVNIIPRNIPANSLKDLTELQDWYFNQFLTLCGFNNNQDVNKKERLLVDEINANNEAIDTNIQPMIEYMQEQLDVVNKVFGTHITIKKMEETKDEDICRTDSREDKSGSVSGDNSAE